MRNRRPIGRSQDPMTTAPHPTHTPAKSRDDNRAVQRILKAAEALFSDHGYDGASINAIAKRAGVSKANVFHHFPTKNALYLAVLSHCCSRGDEFVQALDSGDGDVVERLRTFAREHLNFVLKQDHISRLIARELLKNRPKRAEELAQQIFGRNFERIVAVLRNAQAQGEIRAEIDPAAVAVLLIAADVFYFQSRAVLRHLPHTQFSHEPERYTDTLLDIIFNGALTPARHHKAIT